MGHAPLQFVIQHIRRVVSRERASGLSDAQLVECFANQADDAAFEVLLSRHGPMVLGVCQRLLGHVQDAEDAFQATFLAFVSEAPSISRRQSVGGWLYKVAHRIALKAKAQATRRAQRERQASDPPIDPPADEIVWRDLRPVLDEEVSRLPERYRLPLVLCDLQGKTQEAAAGELGWAKGTVSTRLTRARALLRGRLVRRGLTLSAAALASHISNEVVATSPTAALVGATSRAVLLSRTANTVGGGLSASVVSLAQSALRGTFATKLKIATALVLVAAVAAAGMGLLAREAPAGRQQADQESRPGEPGTFATPLVTNWDQREIADPIQGALPLDAGNRVKPAWLRPGIEVSKLAFSGDGRFLACQVTEVSALEGLACTVRFWDAATGRERQRLPLHRAEIAPRSLALSADGKFLATTGEEGVIHLWDTVLGKEIHQLQLTASRDLKGRPTFAFSPDGKFLVSSVDSYVDAQVPATRLWDVASGKESPRWKGRVTGSPLMTFSPDSKTLAVGLGENIVLYAAATGDRLHVLRVRDGGPCSLCFSPDGKTLASGGRTVRLWDADTGKETRQFAGPEAESFFWLAFLPARRALAGLDTHGTCRVWDLTTAKDLWRFRLKIPSYSLIREAAFSPDGKILAWSSGDGVLHVHDVATGAERYPDGTTQPDNRSAEISP